MSTEAGAALEDLSRKLVRKLAVDRSFNGTRPIDKVTCGVAKWVDGGGA